MDGFREGTGPGSRARWLLLAAVEKLSRFDGPAPGCSFCARSSFVQMKLDLIMYFCCSSSSSFSRRSNARLEFSARLCVRMTSNSAILPRNSKQIQPLNGKVFSKNLDRVIFRLLDPGLTVSGRGTPYIF